VTDTRPSTNTDADWQATLADWLAGIFAAAPSDATVDSYRTGVGALLLEALHWEPGCSKGATIMQRAFIQGEPTAAAAHRFSVAFTQLFEGLGGPHTVPPFESAHASPSGRLFQASSSAMKRRLREAELTPSTGDREPADHLSVELALLASLMRRDGSEGAQLALLNDHLLVWVPGFARAVAQQDSTGFYGGAALALSGFLAERQVDLADRSGHRSASQPSNGISPC
jgi:TorA-specific chaperone